MSDHDRKRPGNAAEIPDEPPAPANERERHFHGWRLIGFIMIVVVVLAAVSFVVDWMVIGPLEGRVF